MALAASVVSLASEVRSLCDSSDPSKRILHAFSSKMSALLPVVRGFDSAEGDSDEARSVLATLRTELEAIAKVCRDANRMSRAAYYVKGREVRVALTGGMRRIHFALTSLRLSESEAMRSRLADFSTEWLAMDVELSDEGQREKEERGNLVRVLEDRIYDDSEPLTMDDLEELAGITSRQELVEALKELIAKREALEDDGDDDGTVATFFTTQNTVVSNANTVQIEKNLLEQLIEALEAVSNGGGGVADGRRGGGGRDAASRGSRGGPRGSNANWLDDGSGRGGGGRGRGGRGGGKAPDSALSRFQQLGEDMRRDKRRNNQPQAAANSASRNAGGAASSSSGQQGKMNLGSVLSMPEEFANHTDDFSVFHPNFHPVGENNPVPSSSAASEKRGDKYREEDRRYRDENSYDDEGSDGDYEDEEYYTEEEEEDDEDDRLIFRCRVVRRGTVMNIPDAASPRRGGGRRSRSKSPDHTLAFSATLDKSKKGHKSSSDLAEQTGALRRRRSADLVTEMQATSKAAATGSDSLFDEHVLRLPWDADVNDLKDRLSDACGISRRELTLCSARESRNPVVPSGDRDSDYSEDEEDRSDRGDGRATSVKLAAPLDDNRKSCLSFIEQVEREDDSQSGPPREEALIVAFESSIRPRPGGKRPNRGGRRSNAFDDDGDEEDEDEVALESLRSYGDTDECRLCDSDPLPLARAMSRNLWPRAVPEFKVGLRVDALVDNRDWAAGSVVEIVESVEEDRYDDDASENEEERRPSDKTNPQSPRGVRGGQRRGGGDDDDDDGSESGSDDGPGRRRHDGKSAHSESTRPRRQLTADREPSQAARTTAVRIHFDGSSRWQDKFYTIEDFTKRGSRGGKKVCPLGSRTKLPTTPSEFVVYHRCSVGNSSSRARGKKADDQSSSALLFGQPFYLEFHSEWSTARAGAHILAQAARFVRALPTHPPPSAGGRREQRRGSGDDTDGDARALEKTRWALWQLVEELLDIDRKYVHAAVRGLGKGRRYAAAATFDPSDLSSDLRKKLTMLLPRLPFKVRVCRSDVMLGQALGRSSKEVAFPFSLRRTVGNYMKDQHVIVLHWNKVPGSGARGAPSEQRNVLYASPSYVLHEEPKEKKKKKRVQKRSARRSHHGDRHDRADEETVGDDGTIGSMTVWNVRPVATR